MSKITLDRVSKRYQGEVEAIHDVSLEIRDGELMVLLGSSGCGKSTLLRMVAGLEEISSGTIRFDDRVINQQPAQQRNVAMVFQNYALYPHMTVRDNLGFPLRMRKQPAREIAKKVEAIAEMLELKPLLKRKPDALSGGQRQRVAMGRAIIREADLLLMDEPLSNLDARLRVQIRSEIAQLQKQLGLTILYVTHDQTEAMSLGHRIAILHEGRLQQVGTPWDIYNHPANTFVAGFIGSPGMNLVEVSVESTKEGSWFSLGSLRGLISEGQLKALGRQENWASRGLIAGIRPSAIRVTDESSPHILSARVVSHEYLGHETLLTVSIDRNIEMFEDAQSAIEPLTLKLLIPGHNVFIDNEKLSLTINMEEVQFFDFTGKSLM
ncbi:MAG: ABC transporter ATP-binding protein [Candidatus Thiodiazotropha sp.]